MRHTIMATTDAFKKYESGEITAEVRNGKKRPYAEGDIIILQEVTGDGRAAIMTGRELELNVTSARGSGQIKGINGGHFLVCFSIGAITEPRVQVPMPFPASNKPPADFVAPGNDDLPPKLDVLAEGNGFPGFELGNEAGSVVELQPGETLDTNLKPIKKGKEGVKK